MSAIDDILKETAHRPFELPKGPWMYYQEWNRALFLHWAVPPELLKQCVPTHLTIDTHEGHGYISLVAFTMEKIRPRFFPAVSFISDFDEINVRTYIDNIHGKGVYFLNIEAGKLLSALIAKTFSGLPYEKANIRRTANTYHSENLRKGFRLSTSFEIRHSITDSTALDKWLTERYCLYLAENESTYCYDIHHSAWALKSVHLTTLELDYQIGALHLHDKKPDLVHYSDGVQVVAWQRRKIEETIKDE